jgi:co-chaperonin GroES (HSP10)
MNIKIAKITKNNILLTPIEDDTITIDGSARSATLLSSGLYVSSPYRATARYKALQVGDECSVVKSGDTVIIPSRTRNHFVSAEWIDDNGKEHIIIKENDALFVIRPS